MLYGLYNAQLLIFWYTNGSMKIDISIKELFADDSKLHCYEKITVYLTVENIVLKIQNLYKSRGISVLL